MKTLPNYPDKPAWVVKTKDDPETYLCNGDGPDINVVAFLSEEQAREKASLLLGQAIRWNLGALEARLIALGAGLVIQTEDGRRWETTGFCRRAFGSRIVGQSSPIVRLTD